MPNSPHPIFALIVSAAMLLSAGGCGEDLTSTEYAEKSTGGSADPLPGPPPDAEIQYSPYSPANPQEEIASGLLSQNAFDTGEGTDAAAAPPGRYGVTVRNLLVGPGKSTEAASLPGGGVFEVRSGAGTVTIGDREQEIAGGSTFSVSEGESFRLRNTSDTGLALRVYVIRLR